MHHVAYESVFFRRREERLRHLVAVLAYCRIHRGALFYSLVSSYCSYLHSFQTHRQYFHVALFLRRLDAQERQLAHPRLVCDMGFLLH